MQPAIINRGRGPEIAGSRITVYDVLAETGAGAFPAELAAEYQLTVEQIQAALDYIEAHKEEVLRNYQKIKERHARGNPPEIQKIADAIAAKWDPVFAEIGRRAREQEATDERNSCGH